MTDFEELHRWSVEQELRAPLAADSMRALRVKVAGLAANRALEPKWARGSYGFPIRPLPLIPNPSAGITG